MHRYCRIVAQALQLLWPALLAALTLAAPARAAPNHIAATLVAESAAAPGKTVTLAIHMRPAPGWHGYWSNPGDAGLGMTLGWVLPAGFAAGAPDYPVPETLMMGGLMNHVFEHDYAVLVPLTVPQAAAPGSRLPIRVKAEWLACTDQICVPESSELAAELTIGEPAARDPRFDHWRRAMPAPLGSPARMELAPQRLRMAIPLPAAVKLERPHLFLSTEQVVDYAAPQAFSRRDDLLIVEIPRAKFDPATPAKVDAVLRLNAAGDGVSLTALPGTVPAGGEALSGSQAQGLPSLPVLLLSALIGGLLLNIMPCVFPILSLKALSLARAGESEAQARAEGVAYTAGVVIACLALGAVLLALRAGGEEIGWAFQLQEPLVVAALLLLATAITANLMGLFELSLPGMSQAGSPQGAFATGLLAAFAATPCTGPFMAAAMGAALLLPVGPALALFAALGLGIALPFLAIAFIPTLRQRLPRPGAWMVRFRRWMAVPMALTALALLWLASRVAGGAFALALALIAVILIAGLILIGRRQRHGRAVGPVLGGGLALLIVAAMAGLPPMVRAPGAAVDGLIATQPFSEAALASARATGKPVLVWLTADWCLTCKVNERVAIEREATRDALGKAGVIVLKGDWTRRDPAITRYLGTQGAAGVPLYVWYPARGAAPQHLPQVLTPDSLIALARTAN